MSPLMLGNKAIFMDHRRPHTNDGVHFVSRSPLHAAEVALVSCNTAVPRLAGTPPFGTFSPHVVDLEATGR